MSIFDRIKDDLGIHQHRSEDGRSWGMRCQNQDKLFRLSVCRQCGWGHLVIKLLFYSHIFYKLVELIIRKISSAYRKLDRTDLHELCCIPLLKRNIIEQKLSLSE